MSKRTVLAFLVAPMTIPIIDGIATLLFPEQGRLNYFVGRAFSVASFTYLVAVLLGIPAYFLLRRQDWLKWWHITGTGAIIGSPVSLFFIFAFGLNMPIEVASAVGICSVIGATTAFVFWLLAFYKPNSQFDPDVQARRST